MSENNTSSIDSILPDSGKNNNSKKLSKEFHFLKGKNKTKLLIIATLSVIGLGVFSSSAFLFRNKVNNSDLINPNADSSLKVNSEVSQEGLTKDHTSLINGAYITKETYERITDKKPVTVMVNNHTLARPPAGLSQAEVVYEIVAEGGITRFLAVFHSNLPNRVGPVRSMRKYFQQIAAEYFPISSHWGIAHRSDYEKNLSEEEFDYLMSQNGAETDPRADARSYLDEIGLPTLDQTALPADVATSLFYKDTSLSVPTEHTAFIRLNQVYDDFIKVYPEESWIEFQEFDSWKFIDDEDPNPYQGEITHIEYNFWDFVGFDTVWNYNSETGIYERTQGGTKTVDRNNDSILPIKAVVIQRVKETKLSDTKGHLLYDVIGTGDATIYQNGKKIEGTWSKSSARNRTYFKDSLGADVRFNRGLMWIVVLPDYSEVTEY